MKFERYFLMFFGFIFGEMKSFRIWDKDRSKRALCYTLHKMGIKSACQMK